LRLKQAEHDVPVGGDRVKPAALPVRRDDQPADIAEMRVDVAHILKAQGFAGGEPGAQTQGLRSDGAHEGAKPAQLHRSHDRVEGAVVEATSAVGLGVFLASLADEGTHIFRGGLHELVPFSAGGHFHQLPVQEHRGWICRSGATATTATAAAAAAAAATATTAAAAVATASGCSCQVDEFCPRLLPPAVHHR
tara:strand:+ start:4306 stop:4884 length:579 start_codon:yes stop_codon:yes gene_type:complete